jgi:hypothetical protein
MTLRLECQPRANAFATIARALICHRYLTNMINEVQS